jgi:hypothetical protein
MAKLYTEIDETLYRDFKKLCVGTGKKMKDVAAALVKAYVKKNQTKPKEATPS